MARILKRLFEVNYKIEGASDHGLTESIYLKDPDGNGVELYADRPSDQWPVNEEGHLLMTTKPLNVIDLLSELDNDF